MSKFMDRERFGFGLLLVVVTLLGVGAYWPLAWEGFALAGLIMLAGVALMLKAKTRPE